MKLLSAAQVSFCIAEDHCSFSLSLTDMGVCHAYNAAPFADVFVRNRFFDTLESVYNFRLGMLSFWDPEKHLQKCRKLVL